MPSPAPSPADITTERLVLRSWTPGEAQAVVQGTRSSCWADDFPAEGDRVIAGLLEQSPGWLDSYGHRLVIERGSDVVVGSLGLFWPPSEGVLEIGYGIVASHRGRGYATEATRALTAHALTAPGVHTVTAGVDLSNPSSVRVLEKAGFERCSAADGAATYRFRAGSTG